MVQGRVRAEQAEGGEGLRILATLLLAATSDLLTAIEDLGSSSFEKREEASSRILALAIDDPLGVLPRLPQDTSDIETRDRIEKISRQATGAVLARLGSTLDGYREEALTERVEKAFRNPSFQTVDGIGNLAGSPEVGNRLFSLFLPHGDSRVKRAAVGHIHLPELRSLLEHEDAFVRMAAADRLAPHGDPASLPVLLDFLEDPEPGTRWRAISLLGHYKGRDVVQPLLRRLEDKDCRVRALAAQRLGELQDLAVAPALVKLLQDESSDVSQAAMSALAFLQAKEFAVPLVKRLESPDPKVRANTAEALGRMQAPSAIPALVKALQDPASNVRCFAIVALGEIGDNSAAPALLEFVQKSGEFKAMVALALGRIGDPAAVPVVTHLLDDPDPETRQEAVEALGNLKDPSCIPLLRKFLTQEEPARRIAVLSLARLGDKASAGALAKYLEEENPFTTMETVETLWTLTGQAWKRPALKEPLEGSWTEELAPARAWWAAHKDDPEFSPPPTK